MVRTMLESVLSKHGYSVLAAGGGHEGIELYCRRHERIDLVISDITMPDLDGVAMVEQIRSMSPDARVLFTSGRADTLPEWAALSCDFLMKPFRAPKLCEAVSACLNASGKAARHD